MHSVWTRLNAIVFYGLTALLCTSIAASWTTVWLTPQYSVKELKVARVFTLRPMDEEGRNGRKVKRDRVLLELDLNADLSGLFNWNVKQLFVFIKATWETKTNLHNEQIIWDRIIQTPQDAAVLSLNSSSPKYLVIDQKAGEIRGQALHLSIHWDVMPYTGLISIEGGAMQGPEYKGGFKAQEQEKQQQQHGSSSRRHYYSLRLPENPCGFGPNGSQDPCPLVELEAFRPFATEGFVPFEKRPQPNQWMTSGFLGFDLAGLWERTLGGVLVGLFSSTDDAGNSGMSGEL